jgi:very-short-patch-repair endonuclease
VVTDASGVVVDFKRDKSERERLEEMLYRRILDAGLPEPQRQYYWARPERMFRSDFAYPSDRILLEVQGGIWAQNPGRHNRGSGYEDDLRRSNIAVLFGWRLLAFSERMITDGTAVETICKALEPTQPSDYQPPLIDGSWAKVS